MMTYRPGRWGAILRLAASLLSGVAVGMALAACGSAHSKPERAGGNGPLIIEFWHSMAGRQSQSLLEIVAAFNKQRTDIRVVPIYQGSYDALSQKLVASCISGSNPPLSQMYESWTTRFMSRNLIRPVQDLAAAEGPQQLEDLQDIVKAFRDDNTWIIDGKPTIMTLPFNKSIYVLYMNEDRMRQAGFDHPPKNWTEWREYSDKMALRDDAGNVLMYGFATRPLLESFTTNLFLEGKKYIDDEGNFDFAGPEGLEALQFLVNLTQGKDRSGYVETDYLNTAFGAGKIAMYVGSTASFPYNDSAVAGRFIWRAYPLPIPDDKEGRVLAQGTNVGIFANQPEEAQRAAWEFLKFMTNTENSIKWAVETGYLPIRYSALQSDKIQNLMKQNANYRNALGEIDKAAFEPKVIYWESCRLALTREVESALNGRKTPEEALKDALEKVTYIRETE